MRRALVLVLALVVGACGSDGSGGGDGDGEGDGDGDRGPFDTCAGTNDAGLFDEEASCFGSPTNPGDAAEPLVVIETGFEVYEGVDAVHVRLTFSPLFVDNTFGANTVGWDRNREFKDLVGSDHALVQLYDSADALTFELKLDYISEDPDAPCGYSSLGVEGGDGKVEVGDPAAVLGVSTSLDENLNERGICETVDSPPTDASCTPDPSADGWDYRVVYDLWVAASAFDPAGFGRALMESVHASPAKGGENTIEVEPVDCPDDDWDGCLDGDGCGGGGGDCPDGCDVGEVCSGGMCVPDVQ